MVGAWRARAVLFLAGAAMATALAACSGPAPGTPPAPAVVVRPIAAREPEAPRTSPPTAWVEIASHPTKRQKGLSGRLALKPDCGMLFVYPDEEERHFWMRGCLIPLDAAFLDGQGTVVSVVTMQPPAPGTPLDDLVKHPSGGPARYVLEMRAGWFEEVRVGRGARIDLSAALVGVEPW